MEGRPKAADWGYDDLELACWGDQMDVSHPATHLEYCSRKREILDPHGL